MAESETSLSGRLADTLVQRIAAAGPLTIADYMEAALHDPRFGYYATRDPLGARGDFVTAPEISQVFGELLGLWCVDLWQRMGAPDPFLLVELGPGRATMMRDALRAARVAPRFLQALRLHLVERSATLRVVQSQALAEFVPCWHDAFEEVPHGPTIALANEFLDALPMRQFVHDGLRWRERVVTAAGNPPRLAFALSDKDEDFGPAPAGAVREDRPAGRLLAANLAQRLAADGGAALFIDYGHVGGFGDTFQAMRRHRRHDVLDGPGEADLTAHVDFADVRAAAEAAGARAWGPVPQGDFLMALGIETRLQRLLEAASDEAAILLRSGCRRLVDPGEMGRLFQVLALAGPHCPAPAGFGA